MDPIPPEAFLESYPVAIRLAAERLRAIVRRTVPDVVERVRPGWRLIGYDVPVGRRLRYFAYIAPEPVHVHLGFEYGVWMRDPERLLEGAHLPLRKVRYLTFAPGQAIPREVVAGLTREAVRVAALSPRGRMSLALDDEWDPGRPKAHAGEDMTRPGAD